MTLFLRLLFGAFWLVFGLNGLLHFFPTPAPSAEGAAFMDALQQAGYVMPLVYLVQILAGTALLLGRFVSLALLALAPVVGNILLYDLFLNPSGLIVGAVLVAVYAFLLYAFRPAFLPLLKAKAVS